MCSIVASFDKKALDELVDLNSYRGNLNSSITYFDRSGGGLKISQRYGSIEVGAIDPVKGAYTIVHQQAPTGDNVRDNKHQPASFLDPNVIDWCYLWHNGILKEPAIEYLQEVLDHKEETWDTQLLLECLVKYEFAHLSEIDGSFACILFMRGNFYLFRNELAPLFIDKHFTISSTEFPGSHSVTPNEIWKLDLETKTFMVIYKFKTKNNPYKIEETTNMAWWDHEELKSPENRSDRYKITFPSEYSQEEVDAARARYNSPIKKHSGFKIPEKVSHIENAQPKAVDSYGDYIASRLDDLWKGKEVKVSKTPEACDTPQEVKDTIEYDQYDEQERNEFVEAMNKMLDEEEKGTDDPCLPVDQKFGETKYINEITAYLASTYSAHYAQGKVQAFELVDSAGLADGFTMGSVIKYASRYGKKNGHNRKDLLKIIHYAMLQLYVHDKNGYDNKG